jgi:hypothetical protein
MKKNRCVLRLMALVTISALMMTGGLAAEVGSSGDPLVTLSYLEEIFMDQVMDRVDGKIAERNRDIAQQIGQQTGSSGTASDTFTVVTLTKGQTLTGGIGCEVMLRVGSAVCVAPSAPGLIDESAASTLNNGGALVVNHLYMMTIDGRGVLAKADTTKLMVRGTYSIA